jgi:hypothetical protein
VWWGWTRGPELFQKQPSHEVLVTNASRARLERLRVSVAGRTFVAETLDAGGEMRHSFRTADDTQFRLVWQWSDRLGEFEWTGGRVARGPLAQRHRLRIDGDNGVVYFTESLPAPP